MTREATSSNMEQNKPCEGAALCITNIYKACDTYFASGCKLLQEWMVLLPLILILHQEVRKEERVSSTHSPSLLHANFSVGQPQEELCFECKTSNELCVKLVKFW